MPRGSCSGNPETIAKRRATYAMRRARNAARAAQRLLTHVAPNPADAGACRDWLAAMNVSIDDPGMSTLARRHWVLRARRAMM